MSAGIDLVEVDEVRRAVAAHGQRYLRRVFSPLELASAAGRPARLAGTVAAKEATFKALAVPADIPTVWLDVEIAPPRAHLRGALRSAYPHARVTVSESWGRRHAVAVAIVETL